MTSMHTLDPELLHPAPLMSTIAELGSFPARDGADGARVGLTVPKGKQFALLRAAVLPQPASTAPWPVGDSGDPAIGAKSPHPSPAKGATQS